MKKANTILISIMVVLLAISGGMLGYYYTLNKIEARPIVAPKDELEPVIAPIKPDTSTDLPIETASPTVEPVPENEVKFIIKEGQNQNVEVYKSTDGGEQQLFRVTDYNCQSLRAEDRVVFQAGIFAKTEEEVMQILEDFFS